MGPRRPRSLPRFWRSTWANTRASPTCTIRTPANFASPPFDTSRAELGELLAKERPAVVIIEACLLAGWVRDLCDHCGVRCLVANTTSEAWKFKHLKRKTDKDDALRLAQLFLLDQLPTVTLPPTEVRQWRSLIAVRQALVGRRVAVQNRMRALFVGQGLPAPRGAKAPICGPMPLRTAVSPGDVVRYTWQSLLLGEVQPNGGISNHA